MEMHQKGCTCANKATSLYNSQTYHIHFELLPWRILILMSHMQGGGDDIIYMYYKLQFMQCTIKHTVNDVFFQMRQMPFYCDMNILVT